MLTEENFKNLEIFLKNNVKNRKNVTGIYLKTNLVKLHLLN